jgi:hypothetical protein
LEAVTFKIEPALNNNPSMVSLKWCGNSLDGTCNDISDPSYVCHSYFQVFVRPLSESPAFCGIIPNSVDDPDNLDYIDPKEAMSFTLINAP